MKLKNNELMLYTLPTLAVLNLLDALVSFYLQKSIGSDFETNILVLNLFKIEPSGTLYLVLKVLFSSLLFIYWKKRMQISGVVNGLGILGIGFYLFMLGHSLTYLI